MTSIDNITIKLFSENQIRRFTCEKSYSSFISSIRSLLLLETSDNLPLYYLSHEGKISLSSQTDFDRFVSTPQTPFRVYYQPANQSFSDEELQNNFKHNKIENQEADIKQEIFELKTKSVDIQNNIRLLKQSRNALKLQSRKRNNKQRDEDENCNDHNDQKHDDLKLKIFELQLKIYEQKLAKRSICQQLQSLRHKCSTQNYKQRENQHFQCADKQNSKMNEQQTHPQIGRMQNRAKHVGICDPQLRQMVWETKEKKKFLKMQKRSLKLILNRYTSPQLRLDTQSQLKQINNEINQLRSHKADLISQFKATNENNNHPHHHLRHRCRDTSSASNSDADNSEFFQLRNEMFELRKQLKELKCRNDFSSNNEKKQMCFELKSRIDDLRPRLQACREKFRENKQ